MVANFRARGISRSARKLAQTPTLIKKKNVTRLFTFTV
jgi:aryl carrier-like protein